MRRAERLLLVALLATPPAAAQALQRGFELERTGRPGEAAATYLAALRSQPANIAALLGLERVLPKLGRQAELLPLVRRGLAEDARSDQLRGLLVRTYVALGLGDSAETFVRAWAAAAPRTDDPYRELALAYQDEGRPAEARRALLAGRRALGRADALAVELAEAAERAGDWEGMAREWATAVAAVPTYLPTAADRLIAVPEPRRARVLEVLTDGPAAAPAPVRRLAAEVVLGWGDPARAWTLFEGTLTERSTEVVQALRRFADGAGATGTPAGRRVRGLALARFAELVPPPLAARARADAARALLEAGDREAAQRVLEALAADRAAPPDVQALAAATVIRGLIERGDLAAAAARLEGATVLAGDERLALRLALARAHALRGAFEDADRTLGDETGVEATALRGWVALYRGDLPRAAELLYDAGPYAGAPGDATERSRMLALLHRVSRTNAPELGAALLALARGDSTAAIGALQAAARAFPPERGRAEILLLAGQVAARLGGPHDTAALALFAEVVAAEGSGAAAPAAELEWARVLLRQGRTREAVAHLEHLILTFPESAVVPQARRELERASGAVPRS